MLFHYIRLIIFSYIEMLALICLHIQAPLLLGCDVRNLTKESMQIIGNEEVIAVNQGIS